MEMISSSAAASPAGRTILLVATTASSARTATMATGGSAVISRYVPRRQCRRRAATTLKNGWKCMVMKSMMSAPYRPMWKSGIAHCRGAGSCGAGQGTQDHRTWDHTGQPTLAVHDGDGNEV